jgi:hypothetical protein
MPSTLCILLGILLGATLLLWGLWGSPAGGQTRLNFSNADLQGQDLSGQDWRGSSFVSANLQGADLQGANLRGAIAARAVWDGAQIAGADFSDAYVDRAALRQLCQRAEGSHPITGVSTRASLGCP